MDVLERVLKEGTAYPRLPPQVEALLVYWLFRIKQDSNVQEERYAVDTGRAVGMDSFSIN